VYLHPIFKTHLYIFKLVKNMFFQVVDTADTQSFVGKFDHV